MCMGRSLKILIENMQWSGMLKVVLISYSQTYDSKSWQRLIMLSITIIICDMIKQNELELTNIDFQI